MTSRNKRQKFKELAEKRVTKALKDIKLVGNLANRANYEYDKSDAQKIVSALEKEVRIVKARFEDTDSDQSVTFKL